MNEKTHDYSVAVTGNLKANLERDGLELLDEEFGTVPVKHMVWRDPGLKANQVFAFSWSLSRPVRVFFCVGAVINDPKGGETGFKRDRSS